MRVCMLLWLSVMGVAELLLSMPALTCEQRELIESMALSSNLMSKIVDDVLDLSKMKSGHMEVRTVGRMAAAV